MLLSLVRTPARAAASAPGSSLARPTGDRGPCPHRREWSPPTACGPPRGASRRSWRPGCSGASARATSACPPPSWRTWAPRRPAAEAWWVRGCGWGPPGAAELSRRFSAGGHRGGLLAGLHAGPHAGRLPAGPRGSLAGAALGRLGPALYPLLPAGDAAPGEAGKPGAPACARPGPRDGATAWPSQETRSPRLRPSLWASRLRLTCSAPWRCSASRPRLAGRTPPWQRVRSRPGAGGWPRLGETSPAPSHPRLSELSGLRRLGLVYFLYLFLFSGLEFTLSFLAHERFQFSRWVCSAAVGRQSGAGTPSCWAPRSWPGLLACSRARCSSSSVSPWPPCRAPTPGASVRAGSWQP